MFNKKLNQEDLEELRKRTELINSYRLVTEALEIQKQIYIRNLLPKYSCDLNKNYSVDLRTGQIKEAKKGQEEIKKPK